MKNHTEAEQICIDIYNDYERYEVERLSNSVLIAWETGKELKRNAE